MDSCNKATVNWFNENVASWFSRPIPLIFLYCSFLASFGFVSTSPKDSAYLGLRIGYVNTCIAPFLCTFFSAFFFFFGYIEKLSSLFTMVWWYPGLHHFGSTVDDFSAHRGTKEHHSWSQILQVLLVIFFQSQTTSMAGLKSSKGGYLFIYKT